MEPSKSVTLTTCKSCNNINDNDLDTEDFEIARVWVAKSGRSSNNNDNKSSTSSSMIIPKKLAYEYGLDVASNVILFRVKDGILIKKFRPNLD